MNKFIFSIFLTINFISFSIAQEVIYSADVYEGCAPLTVQFTNESTIGDFYGWNFGDGNQGIAHDTVYTFENPGQYTVWLIAVDSTGELIDMYEETFFVNGTWFTISTGSEACPGENVVFEAQGDYWWLNWYFDDGTSQADISRLEYSFNTPGTYMIKLVGESDCGLDSLTLPLTISNTATPPVEAYTSGGNEACPFDEIYFTSKYKANEYFWNFDDGETSTLANPKHSFSSLGSKMVTLTTTNICGNSNTDTIQIYIHDDLEAEANFTIYPDPVCPGEVASFYAWGLGDYAWTFGNQGTSIAYEPKFIFPDTGLYNVNLVVTNGCGNTASTSQTITVETDSLRKPEVEIYFAWGDYWENDTVVVCPGEDVKLNNYAWDENNLVFDWDMGDGTNYSTKDVVHNYQSAGIFEIKLVATNNCLATDTAYKWVYVDMDALPSTNLLVIPPKLCPGEYAYFMDDNNDIRETDYSYSIWFGDGDSLINATDYNDPNIPVFSHLYPNLGTYNFTMTAQNLCGNSIDTSGVITVWNDANVEGFYYIENSTEREDYNDQVTPGCPGDSIEFLIAGGISYEWHFGDSTSSTEHFPSHIYDEADTYEAYCIATNGCGRTDTVYTDVAISDTTKPNVWFDISDDYVCAGDTLSFEVPGDDHFQSNLSFYWDFNDGSFSTERKPNHAYSTGGDFFVKLILTNGCGSDSVYRHVMVANPIIDFEVTPDNIQPNNQVQFINNTMGGVSFEWDFGDGTTSTQISPTHTYSEYGNYDVSLTSTGIMGCTSTLLQENFVHVHTMQILEATIYNIRCPGQENGAIDLIITGGVQPYSYLWNDGATTQDRNQLESGYYEVSIMDANGITISGNYTISEPEPFEIEGYVDNEICGDDGYVELDITGGTPPYNVQWSNGMQGLIMEDVPAGKYYGTLTDSNMCVLHDSLIVLPSPDTMHLEPSFTYSTCMNADGNVWVTVTGGSGTYAYEWTDDAESTTQSVSGLEAGNYIVYVEDQVTGCYDSTICIIHDTGGPVFGFVAAGPTSCHEINNGSAIAGAYGDNPITYEWNTNPPMYDSLITDLAPGIYEVTATDVNGCMASYYTEVEAAQIPEFHMEIEHPDCYGAYTGYAEIIFDDPDTNLYYYYNWSNGSTDESIQNRNAGTYYVTISDQTGCSFTDSVTLVNPTQLQVDVFSSDITFYGAGDGIIDITILNGVPPFSYNWSNGSIKQDQYNLSAGSYSATITDDNGCTATGSAQIHQPDPLLVDIQISGETSFCYGESATLDAGSNFLHYYWNTGETTQSIIADTTGTYIVTVTDNVSYGIDSVSIYSSVPYPNQELCLVTVDNTTGRNLIVWEKTDDDGIVAFNLYKESASANQYNLLATIPYDSPSVYTDINSNPSQQSDRYRISVIDTCNNESELSEAHKTMHLTVSTGVGVYNLIWENYEGFDFGSYLIYRGTSPNNLTPIGTIQSNLTTYTDYQPQGLYYYQIAVMKDDTCLNVSSGGLKTQGGPYTQSFSNLDDNGVNQDPLVADFEADITTVYLGESVNFYSTSTGSPSSWEWSFEGGEPATSQLSIPPAIHYDSIGLFDVQLLVSDGTDSSTATKTEFINVVYNTDLEIQFMAYPRYISEAPYNVSFDNQTPGGESYNYLWNFGDGNTSTLFQPFYTYQDTGLYTVKLIATNPSTGITDTLSKSDYIYCSAGTYVNEIANENGKILVIPNPVKDKATIFFPNKEKESYSAYVRDVSGKLVWTESKNTNNYFYLDASELRSGIYSIEIKGKENYNTKIIIQ